VAIPTGFVRRTLATSEFSLDLIILQLISFYMRFSRIATNGSLFMPSWSGNFVSISVLPPSNRCMRVGQTMPRNS
jgi:hypothetical protein